MVFLQNSKEKLFCPIFGECMGDKGKLFERSYCPLGGAADESILGFSAWENDKTVANISASLRPGRANKDIICDIFYPLLH